MYCLLLKFFIELVHFSRLNSSINNPNIQYMESDKLTLIAQEKSIFEYNNNRNISGTSF